LLQQTWSLTQIVQNKLVSHHSAKSMRGAEITFINEDGDEVTRKVTPREAMRHMGELHTYAKLTLRQQKLDAGIHDEEDETEKTLNDFVTEVVPNAGQRMHDEAMALGLDCAAALPDERCAQIVAEEQAKYDAEHPKNDRIGRKKPLEIPPDQRNDWVIPQETQAAVMARLVDMALPDGEEYQVISPRERLMASRLLGRFCHLGQEQQFLNQRLHAQKPETDWDEIDRDVTAQIKEAVADRRKVDTEFYKTHERFVPPPSSSPNTEGQR
jgi:hypothetical protein